MDTKALRQKILDMAIHGRLVRQDPMDEPASVLLRRIREEKERLAREGKIKREKKSAKTSDTAHENVPFEVPSGWEWTTLGELFTLQAGKNIVAANINDKQTTKYKYSCYGGNGIRGYVSDTNRKGDYPIIGRQGALCGNVNLARGEFYATEHAVVVERYDNTDLMWAYYTLISLNLNQYATATAQPGLAVNIINEVNIPLPPYAEQIRISEEIERWFGLIDIIESGKAGLQAAVKQAKAKILDMAIHGRLVGQDPTDEPAAELLRRINPKAEIASDNAPFEVPEGWAWTRLEDVCDSITAGGDKPNVYSKIKTKECSIPIYSNGIENNGLYGFTTSAKIYNKSITVSARGTIGFVCIRTEPFVPIVRLITITPIVFVDIKFMSFYLDGVLKEGDGSSIPQLTVPNVKRLLIPLPPLAEQHRIVAKIEQLFAWLDRIEAEL